MPNLPHSAGQPRRTAGNRPDERQSAKSDLGPKGWGGIKFERAVASFRVVHLRSSDGTLCERYVDPRGLRMGEHRIVVQQIRSAIRRPAIQGESLSGLRLGKIGRVADLPETLATRGMIAKVKHLVRVVYTSRELDEFVAEAIAEYRDILIGPNSRVTRGAALWDQFDPAVATCHSSFGKNDSRLIECVNEMAVAKVLVDDPALKPFAIEYEPNLLPDGRRIDFVVNRGNDRVYVEVKTVRPKTKATTAAYKKFKERRKRHPNNVEYVVNPEAVGGAIYGDSFASRSHFLQYSIAFEERLAAAKAIQPGLGILVFCGNGFAWHRSELEDWADFYHLGKHRADDPFGPMELHHLKTNGIALKRNIDHFAYLKRPFNLARRTDFKWPVRGPVMFR